MRGIRNISLDFTEEEHSFILNMEERCASIGSSEISKESILRTLIRLLQRLEVDVSEVETEDQLLQRLQDTVQ